MTNKQKSNWLNPRKHPDIPMKTQLRKASYRLVFGWLAFSKHFLLGTENIWTCNFDFDYLHLSNISWEELMNLFNFAHVILICQRIFNRSDMWFKLILPMTIVAHLLSSQKNSSWLSMAELTRNPSKWVDLPPSLWYPIDSYPQASKIQYDLRRCLGYDVGAEHLLQVFGCVSLEHLITSHANPLGKQLPQSALKSVGFHWIINYPKFLNHALFFTTWIF